MIEASASDAAASLWVSDGASALIVRRTSPVWLTVAGVTSIAVAVCIVSVGCGLCRIVQRSEVARRTQGRLGRAVLVEPESREIDRKAIVRPQSVVVAAPSAAESRPQLPCPPRRSRRHAWRGKPPSAKIAARAAASHSVRARSTRSSPSNIYTSSATPAPSAAPRSPACASPASSTSRRAPSTT